MTFTVTPSKITTEVVSVPFDFSSQLTNGETITSQAVTVSVFQGEDANPSALLSGSASVSGTVVSQLITGGVAGVVYLLDCGISTSLSQELIMQTYLAVTTSNPF